MPMQTPADSSELTTVSQSRRQFLQASAVVVGAFAAPTAQSAGRSAADELQLGFISCGGRAGQHMQMFSKLEGIRISAVCDPDESRMGKAAATYEGAKSYTDLRRLIDDETIDAVVVATTNHWHCLAAIWAMEAGKDVYVEKPLSHSQWEGRQTVNAARKYDRICQVGTQQRSDPMQAEIQKFLHDDQALGPLKSCRVNRFGVRGPIGKRETPLPIDSSVNYDLWLGPAQDKPIFRDKLQYDWHWDWNTGSGEMGNWGVHVLDDVRNNVFRDSVKLPQRIMAGGGRVVWNDAGETPNVHFVFFDTGSVPVVIGLSNLTAGPEASRSPAVAGPSSGYVVYCDGGRLEGQRGSARAYDSDGKLIRSFKGNGGNNIHHQNFADAVRSRDRSTLNTEVAVGNDSTGWCNLANIGFRVGGAWSTEATTAVGDNDGLWSGLVSEMQEHLSSHNIPMNSSDIRLSPVLTMDAATETFSGENAAAANALLRREYREPYVVPEIRI